MGSLAAHLRLTQRLLWQTAVAGALVRPLALVALPLSTAAQAVALAGCLG
jgi:hypothetical protein